MWFCINLDVLRAPNNVAVLRIGEADNSVDRSGKPAPLYLKECININININIYIYIPTYVCVNVVRALMIDEHIVLTGFPMF